MILSKPIIPYFFLGFLLSSYLKIPVLGVALFGLILVFVITKNNDKGNVTSAVGTTSQEVDYDDDDF